MAPKISLSVEKVDSGFAVQDENGTIYGPIAASKKEAEETLKDWRAYYAGALVSAEHAQS